MEKVVDWLLFRKVKPSRIDREQIVA